MGCGESPPPRNVKVCVKFFRSSYFLWRHLTRLVRSILGFFLWMWVFFSESVVFFWDETKCLCFSPLPHRYSGPADIFNSQPITTLFWDMVCLSTEVYFNWWPNFINKSFKYTDILRPKNILVKFWVQNGQIFRQNWSDRQSEFGKF